MKTSKYIQIALLLFIIGATLTLFISAKRYANNPETKMGTYFDTKYLDSFSVIVAEENADFQIKLDTINKIISHYKHQGRLNKNYEFNEVRISHDTLFVGKAENAYKLVIQGKSIKKIIGKKNSEIYLSFNINDSLSFDLDKSKLVGTLKKNSMKNVEVNARNHSDIQFRQIYVKLPDSVTTKPTYKVQGGVIKHAKIMLKSNSKLKMPHVEKLEIDADSSSTYNIDNAIIVR